MFAQDYIDQRYMRRGRIREPYRRQPIMRPLYPFSAKKAPTPEQAAALEREKKATEFQYYRRMFNEYTSEYNQAIAMGTSPDPTVIAIIWSAATKLSGLAVELGLLTKQQAEIQLRDIKYRYR